MLVVDDMTIRPISVRATRSSMSTRSMTALMSTRSMIAFTSMRWMRASRSRRAANWSMSTWASTALRSTRSMSACRSIRSSTAWTSTRRSTASTGTIPSIRSIALGWCSSATGPILSPRPPDRRHARGSVGLAQDHARPDRVVRRLVDQDEAARRAVPAILVEEQGRGGAQRDPSDLVEAERFGVLVAVQLVHVEPVEQVADERPSRTRRVLNRELGAGPQLRLVREPAHHRVELLADTRVIVRPADHVAPAHVDLVVERHRDRHGRERLVDRTVGRVDGPDRRGKAGGQHHDVVAGLEHAAGDHPGIPPVVVVRVALGPDHVLDREPAVDQVPVRRDVHLLEVVEKRGTVVPLHVEGTV